MASAPLAPLLSKSRFQHGLQCLKRLYLECYRRDLADPIDPARQAIFDMGTAVGEVARGRFPHGVLIEETYREHDKAVRTTEDLLHHDAIPALYEAAFTFRGIRARVDILNQNGAGEYDLVEVKSTARVKPEHITDAAIQVFAAEGSGISINNVYLMHLNREYVYAGGNHDMEQLFTLQDITGAARDFVAENVSEDLAGMWAVLQLDDVPEIATGRHCSRPYRCSFYGHCHQDAPVDHKPLFVSPDLAPALHEINFPAAFLDFETFNPAIPVFEGTSPYQAIPFQWSLHVLDESGMLGHEGFLNDDALDPREKFAASLLNAVPAQGSIVAYSGFETARMQELAKMFPQYEDGLLSLCERTIDLLKIIRANYYHPEFHGSYSLKAVLPALAPGMGYSELEVAEGISASSSYARMIAEGTPEPEKQEIRQALLTYCQRDTEAMVHIYRTLVEIVVG